VQSKTDLEDDLQKRLDDAMKSLPLERRGTTRVIPPEPPTPPPAQQ